MAIEWRESIDGVDWAALSEMYRRAPLGDKSADWLRTAFTNSLFKCFAFEDGRVIAAGRAVADGVDCSYLCDIAVDPDHQGRGLGRAIIEKLVERSRGHRKIILYSVPGREPFYAKFGFRRMRTAMAVFEDPERAARGGYIDEG
ncbi:GNAT family N-acetyltransferase [Marilutibacter chinensis]|uniref:GNAT family N-acetyltransferase n=1 Tax=Marilutibacter chinensis TaxID=2912247 RepID=A0ABS9HSX1_9GAMM|nr:GNAT family N-acetyltransferase [Lysobacter chinensis]MCF7221442.1 GNAT family N-acetyltransferase [Lysobacter chinensis]